MYDEFGNYIGPDIDSDESEEEIFQEQEIEDDENEDSDLEQNEDNNTRAVVLHEDKRYYPTSLVSSFKFMFLHSRASNFLILKFRKCTAAEWRQ